MSPSTSGRTDPRFVRHLLQLENAFARRDEASDADFYSLERMVSHLDARALETVEGLIGALITERAPTVLDLMASWDSHLPASLGTNRVVGLGLNQKELEANPALTEHVVHDLNADPVLPFQDEFFDVVLNTVSVDYLTHPIQVFREVGRILRPGGLFLVTFSNRWFPPKVVRVWEEAKEEERLGLVEEYMRSAGGFEESRFFISMGLPRPESDRFYALGVPSDPVFAVFAERAGGEAGRPARQAPRDPADLPLPREEVAARKKAVAETGQCPYCQEPLSTWLVPDDPCIDWPNEYLSLCFNDACPFVVRGWRHMWNQGVPGVSYRYLFNPVTGGSSTVPIRSLADLRPGIVDEVEAQRYPRPGVDAPSFAGLPRVKGYGPEPGIPRG